MANQQLIDYISAQRAKGVGRDAINAALLGAGWSAADVSQAMDAGFGPATMPNTPGAASSYSAAAPPNTSFFKPAAQPSTGPVSFQPKIAQSTSPFGKTSPAVAAFDPASVVVTDEHHMSKPIIAAVVVVALLVIGGLAYWYFGGSPTLPAPGSTSDSETVIKLTQTNTDLQAQAGQMTATIADLENQLSIFTNSAEKSMPLTIRGALQQSSSTKVFTLVTNKNVVITVANSKDAKVVAALTPLVGTTIELQGTHPPVSSLLTVTHVNGTVLATPVVATTTPSTTTTTGTSTTP